MYIAQIEVTDLRSFSGKHVVSLDRGDGTYAGWTVLAGRNGSGKSTLLKAIGASVVGPVTAHSLAGSFPAWVRQGAKVARIATQLVVDDEVDRFQPGGNTSKKPFWVSLEWRPHERSSDTLERGPEMPRAASQKSIKLSPADRGPWADVPNGWFLAGYGPYRHLGPTTAQSARMSANPVLSRLANLYTEEATLSDAIDWLIGLLLRSFEKDPEAEQLLRSAFALISDGLLPDGSKIAGLSSEGLFVRRGEVMLPLKQVSDGYRTVTALVVDLARCLQATYGDLRLKRDEEGRPRCDLPGVVLIDEVDAHMHVAWQQKIGVWLTKHFPNIQFIVTTHSPFICQAASTKGIIRLPAPGERRTIEHIDARLFKAIVNGSADDAVMSELFGLEHAHSDNAEALREEVAQLEFRLLTGKAAPREKKRHKALKAQLPDDIGEVADRKLRAVKSREKRP